MEASGMAGTVHQGHVRRRQRGDIGAMSGRLNPACSGLERRRGSALL
jgi:hypothetical protein